MKQFTIKQNGLIKASILFVPLILLWLSACTAQQVYEGTEDWRLDECRSIGNLDEKMACEKRARRESPYPPDASTNRVPRDVAE